MKSNDVYRGFMIVNTDDIWFARISYKGKYSSYVTRKYAIEPYNGKQHYTFVFKNIHDLKEAIDTIYEEYPERLI